LLVISGQAAQIWDWGESENQYHQRARAALDLTGREMKQSLLPLDASQTKGLQLVINPSSVSQGYPNTVFWQAAVAKDKTCGDIAEIGYFIRWNANTANLCRFYVPSGGADYLIYTSPDAWVTDAILDKEAPADKANGFQGLFLENVVGLWVTAYAADGTAYASYNSRTLGNTFPAYVDISLVFLNLSSANRMKSSSSLASSIQSASQTATDAQTFLKSSAIAPVRQGAGASTFRVYFSN